MTTAMTRQAQTGGREHSAGPHPAPAVNPWHALWAMVVGFFMILVDATIVAVANFKIMAALDIGFDTVLWVTSAYLLAYAVPLLVSGRLGDRFGPKNVYLIGLAVFTAASLWCGLSGSIGMLIAARVVQGIGAALLTPQTLTMITRIFPPERRGVAMSLWGATAGVATLVGPLAGGALADSLGWEWIFFINVPVGVVGLVLAVRLIPALPTHAHRFDLIGVALSGVGVFLIVFALQEGQASDWQPWIWAVIVAGIGCLVMFGYWQSINRHEPLVPLHIFGDRDFCLSNIGVAVIGFMSVAMMFPVMFYAQGVCGLSPTRSALLTAPMPIAGAVFAPLVGKIVDRSPPRPVVGFGFSTSAVALTWLSVEMMPTTPIWRLLLPLLAMGIGMAFIWAPLGATATRNLSPDSAGAGSGVFNAIRQIGTVLGSAGMAAFMSWRLSAEMPHLPDGGNPQGPDTQVLQLPAFLREPFSAAMSQSMLLPAFIALFGVVAALFLVGGLASAGRRQADATVDGSEGPTEPIPPIPGRWTELGGDVEPAPSYEEEDDTEPLAVHAGRVGATSAAIGHADPLQPWPGPVPEPVDEPIPRPKPELIGFAHNGFHVDDERRFRSLTEESPSPAFHDSRLSLFTPADTSARHRRAEPADDESPPGSHHRVDSDAAAYGRHSRRDGENGTPHRGQ